MKQSQIKLVNEFVNRIFFRKGNEMKKQFFIVLFMLLSLSFCAQAATYSYLNTPSGSYPDNGTELTDGYLPVLMDGTPWGDEGWVGFANANPSIIFDLGASQNIAALKLYCFGGTGGINVPAGATISFSEDGTTFSGDVTYGAFNTPTNMVSWTQITTTGKTGRYVKIQLTSAGEWLFIGEVQILESLPITYSYSSGTPNVSYPDSGEELTNGYLPVVPSSGDPWSDAGWVGFADTNPTITFDLGMSQTVNALKLYCFGGTAGINVPAGIVAIVPSILTPSIITPSSAFLGASFALGFNLACSLYCID
jgi:hypothetical protein